MAICAVAGLRAAVIRQSQSSAWDFVLGLIVGLFLLVWAGWVLFGAVMISTGAWSISLLAIVIFALVGVLAFAVFHRLLLKKPIAQSTESLG